MQQGKVVCLALGLLLAGFGCSDLSTDSSDSTEAALTTTTPTVSPSSTSSSSTTVASTTTTVATTTTAVPKALEVLGPFDGEWKAECLFGPIGVVKPKGIVTYLGEEMIDDGQYGPPYPQSDGWHSWVGHPEEPYGLGEGANTLEFVATFADGSTLSNVITVVCDPAAVVESGFVVSMDSYDQAEGYQMTFVLGHVTDSPDGWGITPTDTEVVLPVHPDAIFIVHDGGFYTAQLTVEEFAALVTFVDEGHCSNCPDGDCPVGPYGFQFPSGSGCIDWSWRRGGFASIGFEVLVDAEGLVRQAIQLIET